MTPQFYARYVPTASADTIIKDPDDLEEARPAKKRRKYDDHGVKGLDALKAINLNRSLVSDRKKSTVELNGGAEGSRSERLSEQPANGLRKSGKAQRVVAHQPSQKTTVEAISQRGEQSPHAFGEKESPKPNPDTKADQAQPSADAFRKRKKQKKRRDVKKGSDLNLIADTPPDEGSKHINILSKYQKSVSAAAKPARNDSSKEDVQDTLATPSEIHGLTPIPQPPQISDAPPISSSSALPEWLKNPVLASGVKPVPFDSLPLHSSVQSSLKAKGLTEAFTIQAVVLPLLLPGEQQHDGDLCISASTGSGKTLAYILPMIEALREKPITRLRGLIVVPTRELVNQAREVLELCGSESGLKIGTACGSKNLREEQDALVLWQQRYDPVAYLQEQNEEVDEDEEVMDWDIDWDREQNQAERLAGYVDDYASKVDILVCTPGRLVEHLRHTRGFVLDHVQWLVIDEADRLLDESFQKWVDTVVPALEHQSLPSSVETRMMQRYHLLRKREVRKIILSATITRDISKLNELKLRRPKVVVLQSEHLPKQMDGGIDKQSLMPDRGMQTELPKKLQEIAIQIKDEENKPLYLIELLKQLSVTDPRSLNEYTPAKANGGRGGSTSETRDRNSMSSDSSSSSSVKSSSTPSTSPSRSESESDSDRPQSQVQPDLSPPRVRGSLIFAHSTSSAHRLSRLLSILSPEQAYATATLTKSSAKVSKKILSQFGIAKVNIIISTDRASRGLDIPGLAHVINYDMPPSVNSYIHRVGRTARAGKAGKAITLVGWKEGRWFWNEIGRGQGIQRGDRKITRQSLKENGWEAGELEQYAESLKQLGEETRAGQK
ncbi:MAG: hypothetical protein Q9188_000902 [Gyalolechia gomerana]